MTDRHRKWKIALLIVYTGFMLWLLLGRIRSDSQLPYLDQLSEHMNLRPLHTIRLYASLLLRPENDSLYRQAVNNLAGNVVLFVPLGFLPPLVFPKLNRLWKVLLTALIVMTAVEVLQMLLLVGTCDVDDLILNLLGAAIGYGFFRLISRKKH